MNQAGLFLLGSGVSTVIYGRSEPGGWMMFLGIILLVIHFAFNLARTWPK